MSTLNIESLFGVKGYVALVTGGSSGLGFMICKGLVANGAKVYVVALPTESIEEKVAELNQIGLYTGGSAYGLACDVSNKGSIAKLAEAMHGRETHLDVLISNAGIRRDP
ncbi:hypothetical protein KCU89_g8257, partial [Aureobasidium melanogenum]